MNPVARRTHGQGNQKKEDEQENGEESKTEKEEAGAEATRETAPFSDRDRRHRPVHARDSKAKCSGGTTAFTDGPITDD